MISSLLGKKIGMTQVYDAAKRPGPRHRGRSRTLRRRPGQDRRNRRLQRRAARFRRQEGQEHQQGRAQPRQEGRPDQAPRVLGEVRLAEPPDAEGRATSSRSPRSQEGQLVDVIGVTKGKGFQGVVKKLPRGRAVRPRTVRCSTAASGRSACARPPAARGRTRPCPATSARERCTMQNLRRGEDARPKRTSSSSRARSPARTATT